MQANCCTFSWSPQGNEIAFSRHVTPDVHMAWSPDGTKIVFARGLDLDVDGNIYIVNVDAPA